MLYADDSALLVSGQDIPGIEAALTKELEAVQEWLVENKLSLHLGKTESILFGSKRKLKHQNLKIQCNGTSIESRTNVSYLGVTLDQALTGDTIVNKVITKCSNKIKFLYRNARQLDLKTKKLLVFALIQCHLDYACSSWYSGLTKKSKSRLQVIQNKIIRFLLNLPNQSHIRDSEFSQVEMLPVEYRVNQIKLNHMYKIRNEVAPQYMCNQFEVYNSGHRTRNSTDSYVVPRVNSFGLHSFKFTAVKLWNSLPLTIRQSPSQNVFKNKVKNHLMSRYIGTSQSSYVYY